LVCRAAYLIVIGGKARDQSDSKAVVATALPATPKHREGAVSPCGHGKQQPLNASTQRGGYNDVG